MHCFLLYEKGLCRSVQNLNFYVPSFLFKNVNLGMGNHLIVNDVVYDQFMERLREEENPYVIYTKWMKIADNITK